MTAKWNEQHDYHSSANTDALCVHHLELNIVVNFDLQQLNGVARLQFTRKMAALSLVLDCRDLIIEGITDSDANVLSYYVSDVNAILGQKLVIDVGERLTEVVIHYRTSTTAQGLQWLTPEQTLGKQLPYLFSQSQPINARSWIPLQDTPKARITFNATVTAPQGLRVVMSAENNPELPDNGVFTFCMSKPIPTHLLAIAVGELSFQATGPRSGIYTEPGMLAAAVKEFEDTESMILMAESILGPYAWGAL